MLTCFEQRTYADHSACVKIPHTRERRGEQSCASSWIDGAQIKINMTIESKLREPRSVVSLWKYLLCFSSMLTDGICSDFMNG